MADSFNDPIRPIGEIAAGPSKFEQFLDRNVKGLIALGVTAALGSLGWIIYSGIQDSHKTSAAVDLAKANDLAALQSVASKYAKTEAAGSAQVLLANQQWKADQKDTAIQTLRTFIASHPKHPAIPSAKADLAGYLQSQGKADEAKAAYLELSNDSAAQFLKPYVLLQLGDLAKTAGDLTAASDYYSQARSLGDPSQNQLGASAVYREQLLKAKAPVEIDAPPASTKQDAPESDVAAPTLIQPPGAPLLPQP